MNILELARQAGGKVWPYAKSVDFSYDELERFAALIREECAKKLDELANMPTGSADPRSARIIDTAYMTAAAAIRGIADKARGA